MSGLPAQVGVQQRDGTAPAGRLFVLDPSGNLTFSPGHGSAPKPIVSGCRLPEGIAVDAAAGHIYWTNDARGVVGDGVGAVLKFTEV